MAHNKIIWFHITMDKKFIVDMLDTLKHLVPHHEGRL